jgi:hypothetical protein
VIRKPKGWPTKIQCEMNVEEWERALRKTGLLTKYSDVLHGFVHGFPQGIPQHDIQGLQWYKPINHETADAAREEIKDNFRKELKAGCMQGPYTHKEVASVFPFFRSSPLGTAVNSDGSVRPINDLSYPYDKKGIPSVNSFVDKMDFETTWDDFKTVTRFFKRNTNTYLLGLFDWEKAYRQIPTSLDQWPYLMLRDFDGNLLLDTRITFGGVAGCGSFGRPADAWKEIMLQEFNLVHVFRWVDDNLFVKAPTSTVNMKDVVE